MRDVEKARESRKRYRQRHRENRRQQKIRWRERHPELAAAQAKRSGEKYRLRRLAERLGMVGATESEMKIVQAKRQEERRDPDVRKQRAVDARFRNTYGISLQEYDAMYSAQNGCCAICRTKGSHTLSDTHQREKLVVDHCHNSEKVRGLLCQLCNRALGNFRDSVESLREAIEYLTSTSQTTLTN